MRASLTQVPGSTSASDTVVETDGAQGTNVVSVAVPKGERHEPTRSRPASTGVSAGSMVSTQV